MPELASSILYTLKTDPDLSNYSGDLPQNCRDNLLIHKKLPRRSEALQPGEGANVFSGIFIFSLENKHGQTLRPKTKVSVGDSACNYHLYL